MHPFIVAAILAALSILVAVLSWAILVPASLPEILLWVGLIVAVYFLARKGYGWLSIVGLAFLFSFPFTFAEYVFQPAIILILPLVFLVYFTVSSFIGLAVWAVVSKGLEGKL